LEKLKEENRRCKLKELLKVLQHYNVTINYIEEYKRNKPLIDDAVLNNSKKIF
jgi:hypothetical protein